MNTQTKKEQLVLDVANPRYPEFDPYDTMPYGDAIETMMDSMCELYEKTGSLLLQPVVCVRNDDGTLSVRAGYTRAITFITQYDAITYRLHDMMQMNGVEELTIPVIVFENIDAIDSLMENIVRTEQHYMSTAFAIDKEMSTGKATAIKVATQLGMKAQHVVNLRKLTQFPPELKYLCYRNHISEAAAIAMTDYSYQVQEMMAKYINIENITNVSTVEQVRRLSTMVLPRIPEEMHDAPFTGVDGVNHPHLQAESWVISLGINDYRYTDKEAMLSRAKAWLEVLKTTTKIESPDKWYHYSAGTKYHKVQAGTHPKEVCVEMNDKPFVAYFLHEDYLTDPAEVLERKQENIINKAKMQTVALSEAAKLEMMKKEMLYIYEHGDMSDAILYLFEFLFSRFNNKQKEALSLLAGFEVTELNVDSISYNDIPKMFAAAYFIGMGNVSSDHKRVFITNGIEWDKLMRDKAKELDAEKKAIIAKAEDKAKEVEDTMTDAVAFLRDMTNTIVAGTGTSLVEYIAMPDAEEKVLRYVAKGLGVSYKDGKEMMSKRLISYYHRMCEAFDITPVDEEFMDKVKAIDNIVDIQASNVINNAVGKNLSTVSFLSYWNGIRERIEDFYADDEDVDTEEMKLDLNLLIDTYDSKMDTRQLRFAIKNAAAGYYNGALEYLGFNIMYLNKSGKVTILQ